MNRYNSTGGQNPYVCSFCGFNNTSYMSDFRPDIGYDPKRKPEVNKPFAAQIKSYKCHRCGKLNTIAPI